MISIQDFAARLEASGHTVEWGFEGPVAHNHPGDPGWWCKVDGEIVARGAAIGLLEEELERWVNESGERYGIAQHTATRGLDVR